MPYWDIEVHEDKQANPAKHLVIAETPEGALDRQYPRIRQQVDEEKGEFLYASAVEIDMRKDGRRYRVRVSKLPGRLEQIRAEAKHIEETLALAGPPERKLGTHVLVPFEHGVSPDPEVLVDRLVVPVELPHGYSISELLEAVAAGCAWLLALDRHHEEARSTLHRTRELLSPNTPDLL